MLAIIDTVCFKPYSAAALSSGALGGTESTVVRIAEGLDAQVYQHNRIDAEGRYLPLERLASPSALIVLRDPRAAVAVSDRFPGVPLFVWMHDQIEPGKDRAKRLLHYRSTLVDRGATIVAVSDFHRAQILSVLAADPSGSRPSPLPVVRVYNPLRPGLFVDDTRVIDRDRMIFFSAAQKGLGYALFVFAAIRKRWPSMRLLVANPGYLASALVAGDGVVDLGALEQSVVLEQVAGALCTFNPNFEYPETFGLVLAESNAVGTPVLAHPIGAAAEVLDDDRQILPIPYLASNGYRACVRFGGGHREVATGLRSIGAFDSYLSRIADWRDGARPKPRRRDDFDLPRILDQWRALLASDP